MTSGDVFRLIPLKSLGCEDKTNFKATVQEVLELTKHDLQHYRTIFFRVVLTVQFMCACVAHSIKLLPVVQ